MWQRDILSVGAGFDSTYFRLHSTYPAVNYFEVDLQEVVRKKIIAINNSSILSSLIIDIDDRTSDCTCVKSKCYTIFAQNLNDVVALEFKLRQVGFDFTRPTLVFSECAITYMEEEDSTKLIKWVAEKMASTTFVNYEQVCPDDGFGQIMVAHFTKIQTPLKSLMKYRTLEDQRKRYTDAGWDHCQLSSVMDKFPSILKGNDLRRIFKIEPFDEWEEFHLKCCHYSLAIASKYESVISKNHIPKYEAESRDRTIIEVTPVNSVRLERYGHACVQISNGYVLVIGGFGSRDGHRHGRSNEIICVGPKTMILSTDRHSSITWDAMYQSCTLIQKDEFIIFGGRTSPAKEVNTDPILVKVTIREQDFKLSATVLPVEGARPPPRWRHAAVLMDRSLLIYGGRNKELKVFGDLWDLKINGNETYKWSQKFSEDDCGPCRRFSHAMTSGNGIAYISGGLDDQFAPLNDLWELKIDKEIASWKKIEAHTRTPHIYSHTLHWHRGKLIFVGGVNLSSTHQPHLSILDLTSLQYVHYEFKIPFLKQPVMVHGHCSFLNEEKSEIHTYGGGGNCFSFGTHFNENPLKISLRDDQQELG